jgi:hypothetical protein
MTKDMMDVRSLVEKSADADLLREKNGFAAERLMELEVGLAVGTVMHAGRYAKHSQTTSACFLCILSNIHSSAGTQRD